MSAKIYTQVTSHGNGNAQPVSVLCPACRQRGVFVPSTGINDCVFHFSVAENRVDSFHAGTRLCPNLACKAFVFVIYRGGRSDALASYPAGRLDFDAAGVPEDVRAAFDEALTCHANECWIGAAMLIRKTIEELCHERGATGPSLIERIKALRTKITLPDELLAAADHLRLLGNDAAHVEARAYNQVGQPEIEAGIELARELIKAVYQYKGLLAKLQALAKPVP